MYFYPITLCTLLLTILGPPNVFTLDSETDLNEISEQQNAIKINKCCEPNDLKIDSNCRPVEQYNQSMSYDNYIFKKNIVLCIIVLSHLIIT